MHFPLAFKHIFIWIWEALPDISNLVLVILGVLMSFPTLAETIEAKRSTRYTISLFCIVIGLTGFWVGINQKQQLDSQIHQLVYASSTQASKDDLKTLGDHMDDGLDRIVSAINSLAKKTYISPPSQPPPVQPTLAPQHISYTERRIPSSDPEASYGLQIVIQTDATIQPVAFAIFFDGPISKAEDFMAGASVRMGYKTKLLQDRQAYAFSYTLPPFNPQNPIVVTILSKAAIRVKSIESNPQW